MTSESIGYILPVWVCAAARAALQVLRGDPFVADQALQLDPGQPQTATVPVQAAAPLADGWALGVAQCDPGPGVLDLTRNLQVWVALRWSGLPGASEADWLQLEAGEGVGLQAASGAPCLSAYARALLVCNLRPLVPQGRALQLRLVIPAGRQLAARTSNAAFGVVDGLALIGTQPVVQRSAAPEQLEVALARLRSLASAPDFAGALVLVIGENGLDLAPRLGLPPELLVKAGNWIGPLLVAAAEAGVQRLLVFGYQGKLIKLAGGIFHTHHHLADGRAEVLTALAALEGLSGEPLHAVHACGTIDEALRRLDQLEPALAVRLRRRIAQAIEQRSAAYLQRHGHAAPRVGAVLFDRQRRLCAQGTLGSALLQTLGAGDGGGS
ncbi:MAG: cobalt-precorrin-5B (C(1))-methyltransferase [Cyanobacteria bacterium REEB417]|nr:cobalt-precorrin-5B (C(1))-methyltransferase [Cyanobacteria bacterium REEB417]